MQSVGLAHSVLTVPDICIITCIIIIVTYGMHEQTMLYCVSENMYWSNISFPTVNKSVYTDNDVNI